MGKLIFGNKRTLGHIFREKGTGTKYLPETHWQGLVSLFFFITVAERCDFNNIIVMDLQLGLFHIVWQYQINLLRRFNPLICCM